MAETTDQQANSFDNKPDELSQNSDAEYSITLMNPRKI